MRSCAILCDPEKNCIPLTTPTGYREKVFDFICLLYRLGFRVFHTSLLDGIDRMSAYALVRMNLILKDITLIIHIPPHSTSEELRHETCRFVHKYHVEQSASWEQTLADASCLFLIDADMPQVPDTGRAVRLTQWEVYTLTDETIRRIEHEAGKLC